jgi:hypothetical protein
VELTTWQDQQVVAHGPRVVGRDGGHGFEGVGAGAVVGAGYHVPGGRAGGSGGGSVSGGGSEERVVGGGVRRRERPGGAQRQGKQQRKQQRAQVAPTSPVV